MKPIIATIYQSNIPTEILTEQRRVVAVMAPGVEFRQVLAEDVDGRYAHAVGIDRFLESDAEHDTFLFLDVDAIPLNDKVVPWLLEQASQGCLVGPAQRANHIENGQHIYAAPSAVAFNREIFERVGRPSFDPSARGDVGEELTYRCEAAGVPVKLLLPTGYIGPVTWPLKDGIIYGHGTTYADAIFHAFQIRFGATREMFLEKCRQVCPVPRVASVIVHRGTERLPLLLETIRSLRNQDQPVYVAVVEQDESPLCRQTIEPEVDHYFFAPFGGQFQKTWAFNCAVKAVNADFVLLHDGDLVVPRDYVSKAVELLGDADAATPWAWVEHLSPESTAAYPDGERVIIDRMDSDWNKGASTLVRRSWFLQHKGMDERFCGWGAEDDAFVAKVKALGTYVRADRDSGPVLTHLYHKPRVRQSSREGLVDDVETPKSDLEQYWRNFYTFKDDYENPDRIREIVASTNGWGNPNRFRETHHAKREPNSETICLCMIVRNEEHVIRRCLDSVKAIIDHWVIVDTGSTDKTIEVIAECMDGIPGAIFREPWVDFATNRNQALSFAKGKADYTFVIDADEWIEILGRRPDHLTDDVYAIKILYDDLLYPRGQLIRSALPWKYVGPIHEVLMCNEVKTASETDWFRIVVRHDGSRARDPLTYHKDALILEKALLEEPNNQRNMFYLAQSYRDAGNPDRAIPAYKKRVEMGGWTEEVFYSLYRIACLREGRGDPWSEVMIDYLVAYQYQPDRAEPLYRLGMHYQALRQYNISILYLSRAAALPFPQGNRLFIEHAIYSHLAALEYAVACYWTGDHKDAIRVNETLLAGEALPGSLRELVSKNLKFSYAAC